MVPLLRDPIKSFQTFSMETSATFILNFRKQKWRHHFRCSGFYLLNYPYRLLDVVGHRNLQLDGIRGIVLFREKLLFFRYWALEKVRSYGRNLTFCIYRGSDFFSVLDFSLLSQHCADVWLRAIKVCRSSAVWKSGRFARMLFQWKQLCFCHFHWLSPISWFSF